MGRMRVEEADLKIVHVNAILNKHLIGLLLSLNLQ